MGIAVERKHFTRINPFQIDLTAHHYLLSTIAIQAYNLERTLGQATKGGLRSFSAPYILIRERYVPTLSEKMLR
jgi:hypothetical protein